MRAPIDQSTPRPPVAAPPPVEVPEALRPYSQWVGWSYRPTKGGLAKVPHTVPPVRSGGAKSLARTASTTDPGTWASYTLARPYPRIGFVFTEDDPFCGVDLDDCLDPDTGELSFVARVAIRYLASYAEVSPSGRGVKVIARGAVPGTRRQNRALGVEMYDSGRFFALTGHRLPGVSGQLVDVDLGPLYRWIFGPTQRARTERVDTDADAGRCTQRQRRSRRLPGDAIISKALGAKNGARFERLWRGYPSGYPSRSEADLALCAMLAYWCDCDPWRVEELFSRSGLAREKWHSLPDYRRRTIERAITRVLR